MRSSDTAIDKIKALIGTNEVHAYLLKFSGSFFRNLLAKVFNALLSHKYVPAALIRSKIKPVIKNVGSSKCDSTNYRPVVFSDNLLKVYENCLVPTLTKHLPIHCNNLVLEVVPLALVR